MKNISNTLSKAILQPGKSKQYIYLWYLMKNIPNTLYKTILQPGKSKQYKSRISNEKYFQYFV